MSKNIECDAKEHSCHPLGLHLDLFRITRDLDADICKTVLFYRDKSEAPCINCNNPLPE